MQPEGAEAPEAVAGAGGQHLGQKLLRAGALANLGGAGGKPEITSIAGYWCTLEAWLCSPLCSVQGSICEGRRARWAECCRTVC